MKIRKVVLVKRLQASLAKLDAAQKAVDDQFQAYKDAVIAVLKEKLVTAETAKDYCRYR